MLLLEVNNLKKYFNDKITINIPDLKIYSSDRIGLVGANGAGKTTFLNLLSGKIEPDFGNIKLCCSFSYITQFGIQDITSLDVFALKTFNSHKNYSDSMSGGEKTRFKLSKCFSNPGELILADEPTSSLDIKGIKNLEHNLKLYKGGFILISHDRTLLDSCCNKILELNSGTIKIYNGNYSDYRMQKDAELKREDFEYRVYVSQKQKIERTIISESQKVKSIKKAPSRMGNSEARLHKMGNQNAQNKLGSSQKALQKRLERLEIREKPSGIPVTQFKITGKKIYSKLLISSSHLNKSFKNKIIFNDARFQIYNGSKTGIIGDNGTGKTTLVKMIMENSPQFDISQKLSIGYFSQDLSILNNDESILENVLNSSIYDEHYVRHMLAFLLFKYDDVYKCVKYLSGGEKVKVALAKILCADFNMLILDEPTNYLDLSSIEAIETALKKYKGTIILVSHDRKFIDSICNHLLIISDEKIKNYIGNYSDYENSLKVSCKNDMVFENKKLILNNRLTEILSRISTASKNEDISELDKKYKDIFSELRNLK